MKKAVIFLLLIQASFVFSQSNDAIPGDKSIVYFSRSSGLGALINFTFFDGEKVIGRFNGPKYMKYECSPGKHLFWARSENKSFVEADLEGGKMYIIDVVPKMGGFKTSVSLVPVNKEIYKLKRTQKLLSKREGEIFSENELSDLQQKMSEVITRGMERYKELKEKGKSIPQLTPKMTIDKEDLVYVKKPKKRKKKAER